MIQFLTLSIPYISIWLEVILKETFQKGQVVNSPGPKKRSNRSVRLPQKLAVFLMKIPNYHLPALIFCTKRVEKNHHYPPGNRSSMNFPFGIVPIFMGKLKNKKRLYKADSFGYRYHLLGWSWCFFDGVESWMAFARYFIIQKWNSSFLTSPRPFAKKGMTPDPFFDFPLHKTRPPSCGRNLAAVPVTSLHPNDLHSGKAERELKSLIACACSATIRRN